MITVIQLIKPKTTSITLDQFRDLIDKKEYQEYCGNFFYISGDKHILFTFKNYNEMVNVRNNVNILIAKQKMLYG